MANIKISELNELETKNSEDLLAIVDTNNNETKKIKVETLAPENFELKLISDTEPTGLTQGDCYYNTTTNKIYRYVGGGVYLDLGEPKTGILYIIYSSQTVYVYNGTTLVNIGGSSSYSDLGNKPSINGNTLNGNKTNTDLGIPNALNEYSTSTTDGYSCNYSNEHFGGVVLYDNFTGSTSTITLSDNASNYRFIDIMFQGNNGTTDTTRAYDLTKGINLFTANVNSGVTNAWLQFETISFSGNTINRGTQGEMAFSSNGFIELVSSSLKITKVIGYK